MTDFILAMETRVKTDQAKAAFAAVKTDIAAVGTAAKEASVDSAKIGPALQQGANAASGALDRMEAELSALRTQLMSVTAAEATANKAMASLGAQVAALEAKLGKGGARGGTGAAGGVGNLVAQFNDIGMMMAAGQNPLQLAIQQGSQITQVIGPMGASGAVKALGGALLGMLNPVNLVTYAVIAAAAAFVQWLTSSADEAKSLDDAIGDLETSVKRLDEIGGQSLKSVKEDFGAITPEVAKLNEEVMRLADVQAVAALREAFRALKGEVEGDWFSTDAGQVADLLNVSKSTRKNRAEGETINPVVTRLQESLAELQDTSGVSAQLAVVRDINQQFVAATGGIDNMNAAQVEYYSKVVATETALRRMVVAQQDAARAQLEIDRAAGVENERMGGPTQYDKPVDVGLEQRVAARQEAAALLKELQAQNAMQALINQHGAESVEVTKARAAAEREAFVEMTNGRQISGELKDALIKAYDAGADLAALDISSGISPAVAAAQRLADWLGISLSTARQLAALGPQGAPNDPSGRVYSGRGKGPSQVEVVEMRLGSYITPPKPSQGRGGGGGGGGKVDPDSFKALTDAAEKAMATLEAAVASIHEKVALGLMTTAEGTKAIASAKEQAATSIAELIPKLEKANDVAGPKAAAAVGKWRAEVKGLVVDLGIAGSELSEKLSSNFEKGFASFLAGAKGGKAAMADFKNFILQQLAEIAAQKFTSNIITPFIDSLVGGITGGLSGGTPVKANALGGVYAGPGISAYSGTVVNRPTFFPFAKGTGLMGEAGPEAILPLDRDGSGRLGVRASGGGGGDMIVNISTPPGTKASSTERMQGGDRIIDVIIEMVGSAIAGDITQGRGPMPDALSGTYGLSRIGS